MIKSGIMRWARHVERMGEEKRIQVLVGKPDERDHLGDPGVDGRIILRLPKPQLKYLSNLAR